MEKHYGFIESLDKF
jgi:hypothetical protein